MPRFSETERQQIQQKLLTEGERLFVAHGLKKVTIDELVNAVPIAKASFYKFYEGKEYLYLDIVQNIQAMIFEKLEELLSSNVGLSNKERVKQVFAAMFDLMRQYPILSLMGTSTAEIISRKVSEERMAEFYKQNMDAVSVMKQHGVSFIFDVSIVSSVFQALYQAWMHLPDNESDKKVFAANILLDGVIEQVVAVD